MDSEATSEIGAKTGSAHSGIERAGFMLHRLDGSAEAIDRDLAAETPVAIEFNGFGYAVLMATPQNLGDLAFGFALSERLISSARDVVDVEQHDTEGGIILRIYLGADRSEAVTERIRHRVTDSSCGLCGLENLEQALRPLRPITTVTKADQSAIFRAQDALSQHQPLNRLTGAVHAAALCDAQGHILMAREDVGRHNAFDKLIGAMLRENIDWDGGFALLSSRCSYELVEKAVLANCPLLATISAPSSLAVRRARDAALPLAVLARRDAYLSR